MEQSSIDASSGQAVAVNSDSTYNIRTIPHNTVTVTGVFPAALITLVGKECIFPLPSTFLLSTIEVPVINEKFKLFI